MQPVSREEVEAICGKQLFDKFLIVEKNKAVMQDSLLKQCPYPDCNGVARLDYKYYKILRQYKTTCPDCEQLFCANCNLAWHEGASCEEARRLNGFQWDKIGDKTAGNAQRCPKCSSPFEKTTGCVHMTCPVCEHEWCWVCGLPYHSFIHYGQGMGLMCEIIGGIHFSKSSAWTQFW